MVLNVQILVYFYMILCGCTFLYDLVYSRRKFHSQGRVYRRRKKCRALMLKVAQGPNKARAKEKLVKKMGRVGFLMSFNDTTMYLLGKEETKALMETWLEENRDIFLLIRNNYVETKNINKKAYYAYVVWQYKLCGTSTNDLFVRTMKMFVMEPSTYCRENALCALYATGQVENVLKAYQLMLSKDIEHSPKLVTEGLLTFTGNHRELAQALWEAEGLFNSIYGVAIINYIRMKVDGFEERCYEVMVNNKINLDTRLAAIRYFRSHPTDKATEYMRGTVHDWQDYRWELSAQAALNLEKDFCKETVEALMNGCQSTNWYVRKNSAETLAKFDDGILLKFIAINEEDKFGKEMLEYAVEKEEQ